MTCVACYDLPTAIDSSKEVSGGTFDVIKRSSGLKGKGGHPLIELKYSLVIEATEDPMFFTFYSPDLPGFSGAGISVEETMYRALHGMVEHLAMLEESGMPIPKPNRNATVSIKKAKR